MSSSDPTDDFSDWSNLAADLGLDSSAKQAHTPPPEDEPIPEDVASSIFSDEDLPDAEDSEDTSLEPGLPGEPVADGTDDGTKKRRRRRRRKKGKGGPETPGEGEATGDESVAVAEGEYEAEAEQPVAMIDDEEEQGSHLARETIRTWDVPSWDDIVAGLYRPSR